MLFIEKVVKVLDDFHFDIFREHVKHLSLRSYYPLALIDLIDRDPQVEQDSDWLCQKVYGDIEEKTKKKFFQLAHYTFKLTSHLAKNYPDYLQSNTRQIQYLFNAGELDKATQLTQIVLDVSEKIEDYTTEIKMLNILIQREVLLESAKQTKKYHERIRKLLEYQNAVNDVFEHLHTHFRAKGKPPENGDVAVLLEPFTRYSYSESFSVQVLSRFCVCFGMYYLFNKKFFTQETFDELNQLDIILKKNDYVVFPYLFTILHRISFLKLNYLIREADSEKILEESNQLIEESKGVGYWNSFINIPESYSVAVQASHYASHYMTSYQHDHLTNIPENVLKAIDNLKEICEGMLSNKLLEKKFTIRYIALTTVYSGLLSLGNEVDIKKGIRILEDLLVFHQQTPFHSFIDPIYLNLIYANFCISDYGKVNDNYKRYKKATKGKAVNIENDLLLHGLYYASKWLETNRDQYIKKMNDILNQSDKPNFKRTWNLIAEVIRYYKIPILLGS